MILPVDGPCEVDPEQRPQAFKAEGSDLTGSLTLSAPTAKKVDAAVPVDTAWERVGKKGLAHAVPVTPRSVQDTKGSEKALWKSALEKELTSLEANTVFTRITASEADSSVQVVPTKCVLVLKPDGETETGQPKVKQKARITICGNFIPQVHECSTKHLDVNALRLCIALALQCRWGMAVVDISTAFLNAKLSSSRTVYTKPPGICAFWLSPAR